MSISPQPSSGLASDAEKAAARLTERLAACLGYRDADRFGAYAEEIMRVCHGFSATEISNVADRLARTVERYPKPAEVLRKLQDMRPVRRRLRSATYTYDRQPDGVTLVLMENEWAAQYARAHMAVELDRKFGAGKWRVQAAGGGQI